MNQKEEDESEDDDEEEEKSTPFTLKVEENGEIQVESKLWEKLKKDIKNFVIAYNYAIEHSYSPPQPPANVRLERPAPQDDMARRTRRSHTSLDEESLSPNSCSPMIRFRSSRQAP